MDRAARAKNNYLMGFSCAQSVVLAFSDLLETDESEALRMASSFGGGLGTMREVCGAVSGMLMVAGALYGYDDPMDFIEKSGHFARVRYLADKFVRANGSIVCRELLELDENDMPLPVPRASAAYGERPCADLCASAAAILQSYIENNIPI